MKFLKNYKDSRLSHQSNFYHHHHNHHHNRPTTHSNHSITLFRSSRSIIMQFTFGSGLIAALLATTAFGAAINRSENENRSIPEPSEIQEVTTSPAVNLKFQATEFLTCKNSDFKDCTWWAPVTTGVCCKFFPVWNILIAYINRRFRWPQGRMGGCCYFCTSQRWFPV